MMNDGWDLFHSTSGLMVTYRRVKGFARERLAWVGSYFDTILFQSAVQHQHRLA